MRTVILVGLTLLLSSLAIGQEPKSTPRQKYDALLKEYASASEVWSKKFDGAPGEADPVRRHYEWPAWSFAPRFLRLAEDYPEDSAALDALLWVVALDQNVGENDKALLPLYERALDALAKHHLQDKRVQELCLINVAHDLSVPAERFLRTVMEAGPTREARGYACLGLARQEEWSRDAVSCYLIRPCSYPCPCFVPRGKDATRRSAPPTPKRNGTCAGGNQKRSPTICSLFVQSALACSVSSA
jgi:hypothetical protein